MSIIYSIIKGVSKITTTTHKVTDNIQILDFTISNAYIIKEDDGWVLVDCGLESSRDFIIKTANRLFGEGTKPKGIVLTHGHFDHIGSIKQLLKEWDVSVYAHIEEFPYLTGQKDYPVPDASVGGGLVSKLSPNFPNSSIDISSNLVELKANEVIPILPNWKCIHTPGHTKGHISIYNEKDRIVIVGDAFTSTKQESLSSVMGKREDVSGPPKYLTENWKDSFNSIKKIKALNPRIALFSHGKPMATTDLSNHLDLLVTNFREQAMPENESYY